MDWGFHYAGPLEAKVDMNCTTCLAKARGKCPTHENGNDISCAHCKAVHGGECHAHWGLAASFEHYRANILPEVTEGDAAALEDFDAAAKKALAFAPHPKRTNVRVTMRGESATGVRDFHVEVRSI